MRNLLARGRRIAFGPDLPLLLRRLGAGALLATICAGATACGETGGRHPDRPRVFAEVSWRQRWQVGGSEQDTLLMMPSYLVADREHVYVLETGLHRVAALRLSDGGLAWRLGREGSGPGEFRNPTEIALGPRGELLVLDQGNGRIAVVDGAGAVKRHVRLPEIGFPNGLCALGDGGFLVAALGTEHPLIRVSAAGEVTDRYELPWRDLTTMGSLPLQGTLRAAAGGGCIYALSTGRGFARYDGARFSPHEYVEWFDVPGSRTEPDSSGRRESLDPGLTAAQGLTADGRTIAIGFGGRTDDAGRLVDLYDAGTGAYTQSLRAPRWFWRMERAGDLYLFITRVGGYPAVTAVEAEIQERG